MISELNVIVQLFFQKHYEREWLFKINDSLDNAKILEKKKALDFYSSLDSEATVAEAVENTEQKVE